MIDLTRKEKITILTINRPERKNTFNHEMWTSLDKACDELYKNIPRALIITGSGDVFSAGFDVNPDNNQVGGLIDAVQKHDPEPVKQMVTQFRAIVDRLTALPIPIIAAVNGLAYGGGSELAVRCDMRLVDPKAVFSFSEVTLGLMPDWGGGVCLTRLVGTARAAELILTGKKISAQEAYEMNMVNRISAEGNCLEESIELAESIAANGPLAVRHALAVIRKIPDMPIAEALEFETETASRLIATGECLHGIGAFLAKKKPAFPDIDESD